MKTRPYQKIIAWQEAHILCSWVYKVTTKLPPEERFRLVNQMCRSAYGAPMNIAEGCCKSSPKERARFYEIAVASIEELHYQFFLCRDLGYISDADFTLAEDKISRTSYLINKLKSACK